MHLGEVDAENRPRTSESRREVYLAKVRPYAFLRANIASVWLHLFRISLYSPNHP